jgi:hypothetical protein
MRRIVLVFIVTFRCFSVISDDDRLIEEGCFSVISDIYYIQVFLIESDLLYTGVFIDSDILNTGVLYRQ